jgi:hypothetical protein
MKMGHSMDWARAYKDRHWRYDHDAFARSVQEKTMSNPGKPYAS